ncbi:putative photosystem I PsaE, reaction centre subunit IV [Helianthus annuus]|nr:putative photosystem I PsaE, reaction centre subunit IV [Helianthus annuus]
MAFCNIASTATTGFVVKPNIIITTQTNTHKSTMVKVMFFFNNTRNSRMVVNAAEEPASGAISAEEDKTTPPPIGPKRGTKVFVLIKKMIEPKQQGCLRKSSKFVGPRGNKKYGPLNISFLKRIYKML